MVEEKLVRDFIPSILAEKRIYCNHRVADEDERQGVLLDKLVEEVGEYMEEPCLEELADILEVLHALVRLHGLTPVALEAARGKKERERGGFTEFFVMEIEPTK